MAVADVSFRYEFRDSGTFTLNRALREIRNLRPLWARLGKVLENQLRDHFQARDAKPNSRGWPSKNFWGNIGDATQLTRVTDRDATVSIGGGEGPKLGFKIYGGTIRPKRAKALAIPNTAEAYRLGSPREHDIDRLRAIYFRDSGNVIGALIEEREGTIAKAIGEAAKKTQKPMRAERPERTGKPKKAARLAAKVWYWLMRRTTHKPDKQALPPRHKVEAALKREAEAWARRALDRQNRSN